MYHYSPYCRPIVICSSFIYHTDANAIAIDISFVDQTHSQAVDIDISSVDHTTTKTGVAYGNSQLCCDAHV